MEKYFQEEVLKEFKRYCRKNKLKHTPEELLTFLLRHHFIKNTIMRNYVILKKYECIEANNTLNLIDKDENKSKSKGEVIASIAEDLNVSGATVRNTINKHMLDFIASNNPVQ